MKFGVFLPMSGAVASVDNVVKASQTAESLEYDAVWTYDMSLTHTRENYRNNLVCGSWDDIDPEGDPEFVEPFTSMAAIAALTNEIEVGSAVIQLPLYNPLVVARQAANIDILSKGRLRLGVGIGSRINFFREGYDRIHFPFKKRGYIFNEYLRAIKQLWSSNGPSSFEGKYINFSNLEFFPKPISQKIFIGSGVAEKGLSRVLKFGDGVIFPYRSPDEIRANVKKIQTEGENMGKDRRKIEIAQTVFACLDQDREKAISRLAPTIVEHARGFGSKAMSTDELSRHQGHTVTTDRLMQMSLVGNRNDVLKKLEEFDDAGLQHAVLALIFRGKSNAEFEDAMKVFASEIISSF